jgi:undecaprenyl-diphosphatase
VRRSVLLVVTGYVVIGLAVLGLGWLITHPWSGPVEGFDDPISRWIAGERTGALDQVADAGTLLGETKVGLALGAVVAVVSGIWNRWLKGPLLVGLAEVGHGGIYWAASHADPRDRPPVELLDPGLVPDHSFPSGHVGTAVTVYGAACILLALRLRSAPARRLAVAVLVALPLFVTLARLYEGAHHVTDVATSIAYAVAWLAVLAAALRIWPPGPGEPAGSEPAVERVPR